MWYFTVVLFMMTGATQSTINGKHVREPVFVSQLVKVQGFETKAACEMIRRQLILPGKIAHEVAGECVEIDLPPRTPVQ